MSEKTADLGTVSFFKEDKNFGFITDKRGTEYFFHGSQIGGDPVIEKGVKVYFNSEKGDRGMVAKNIKLVY